MLSAISPVRNALGSRCGSIGRAVAALVTASVAFIAPISRAAETLSRRPNILWLIGENLGPDLACYGAKEVLTPALDRFAAQGVRFTHAFSTAPVCSTSRSAFMTGMFQTTIGAHHHRSHRTPGIDDQFRLPPGIRPITHWLIDAGYTTANIQTLDGARVGTGKTDLNFEVEGRFLRTDPALPTDPAKANARHDLANSQRLFHLTEWSELKRRQPFFAQVNFPAVERSVAPAGAWVHQETNPQHADPTKLALPPYYPDTPAVREDWAGYLNSVSGLDTMVDRLLRRLEADGLADDTIVIFFGDNGRLEARGLDWCYDSGLHVPLIIRWPKNFPVPAPHRPGTTSDRLVTLIDVTATTLALAGARKPGAMQGRVFLGPQAEPATPHAFAARDRTDNAVNRIRSVRTARYRYLRNFMPEKSFLARHTYKEAYFPVYRVLREWEREGRQSAAQATLTRPRLPEEELYDVVNDPYEVVNLAQSADPAHQAALRELRAILDRWMKDTNDRGHVPEPAAVFEYWDNYAQRTHGKNVK
jgi:N-sulfoglucosamine sulfohydrolase